ncbi:SdpI family protein [Pseudonocardia sp. NPDC049635]|uniref:SdpI family protein n=1 Tax=Pseudonocardia sp. NPDC049635 TaxID=3155506 RepID=UPI0033C336CC
MPPTLRLVLAALLLLAGAALVVLAVLGATGRLPRNRFVGVRTPSSLRTADAFAFANRVAARPVGAAGLIGLVGGPALLLTERGGAAPWVLAVIAAAGMLVMAGLGGSFGARAAELAIARQAPPPSCAGACAGCDLVAGCGGTADADRPAGERSSGSGR